jgi:hypothetical protein
MGSKLDAVVTSASDYIRSSPFCDVDMLGRSAHTIKKNTEAVVVANKDDGFGVNAEISKYTITSRDQHAGQDLNIKTDN